MKQIVETNQYYNERLIRNNRIFAGALLFCQTVFIAFYGVFVRTTPTTPGKDQDLVITVGVAILVLIGFGLVFSIAKNKLWSSLGFNLLITVISFQLYFLVSAFWNFCNISGSSSSMSWGNKIPTYLTDSNNLNNATYGITAIQAFKCSLANVIAFAAISGRAGPLEALIISVFGTFMYELNRQLVVRYCFDFGGSMTIFCFGGFYGSIISMILYSCRQKAHFENHQFRIGGKFSLVLSGIGALFCWVFFPFLNIDIPTSLSYNYYACLNTIYCISACVIATTSLSCIIYGKLDFKQLLYSPVAGGVAVGSSAAFINTSLGALLLGIGTAFVYISLYELQKKLRWKLVVQNHVFYLYALLGMCGGLISAAFAFLSISDGTFTISTINNSNFSYSLPSYKNQLIGVGISTGIGICSGLILFAIIWLVNEEINSDYYHDKSYWLIKQDGISNFHNIQIQSRASNESSDHKTEYYKQITVKAQESYIKDKYAYL